MTRPDLAAHDILAALNRHGVDYVVIGAFAAIAQGVPLAATADIDVTPSRDPENLARLSAALDELGAGIRVDDVDEGLPFRHDKRSLAAVDMLNLTCPAGDFDLVFVPAGTTGGYDDIAPRSVGIVVGGQAARAASIEDVARSKEEVGREKDLRTLPIIRRFLQDR